MKKRILLILALGWLIPLCWVSRGQTIPIKPIRPNDVYTDRGYWCLQFLDSNRYELTIGYFYPHSDVLVTFMMSFGTYEQQQEKLVLTDQLLGFRTAITQKPYGLIVTSGLPVIKGEVFTFFHRYNGDLISYMKVRSDFKTILQETLQKQDPPNALAKQYRYRDCMLSVESNKTYRLAVKGDIEGKDVLISEGKWSRQGNVLTLRDSALNASFHAIILPDGKLQSMLLPCLFQGEVMISDETSKNM